MKLFSLALAASMVAASYATALSATGTPSPAPSGATTAAATTTVDTRNFAYAPPTVTIHPGDTVTFRNSDTTAHTVTAADKSFDSGNMAQGATWSHVFAKAGTYTYVCTYHSYMEGTVVVK